MTEYGNTKQEQIILATISCIEKDGIHALTIRSIAKAAGVNIAAVNYYFGSKEKLIDATLTQTLNHFFFDMEEMLRRQNLDSISLVKEILFYCLEGSLRYPRITEAHVRKDYLGLFTEKFSRFLMKLARKIGPSIPREKRRNLRLSLIQMFSAVILPAFLPEFFDEIGVVSERAPRIQRKYIDHLVKAFLTDTGP